MLCRRSRANWVRTQLGQVYVTPQVRLVLIVRAAPKLKVRRRRRPAIGERDDVMELEECPLLAPTVRADERASVPVAPRDLTPDCRGNVPGVFVRRS
jgi:hypothetical protein